MAKKVFLGLLDLSLLPFFSVFEFSDSSSSFFQPLTVICDGLWPKIQDPTSGLDLSAILPICLAPQNSLECIGVQCNFSTSNCEFLKRPAKSSVTCMVSPVEMDDKVFLKSDLVKQQSELALIQLENGKIASGSLRDIPPISISQTFKESTRLQVQWGMDILTCSITSTDCHFWSKDMNQWTTFPSLNAIHAGGSMSVIGDTPIVIAGKVNTPEIIEHGIVEVFNRSTQQWYLGPPLTPVRSAHTTVVLNETVLVVIGGFTQSQHHRNYVAALDLDKLTWTNLNGLPTPTLEMLCGVVDLTYVLCIGGEQRLRKIVNIAYGLDMSLSNPTWERKPTLDLAEPVVTGFIYQLRHHIFCMTMLTTGYKPSRKLWRMKLDETNPTWEVYESFQNHFTKYVSPYTLSGFQVE